jgi:hypothetical protein
MPPPPLLLLRLLLQLLTAFEPTETLALPRWC